METDLGPWGWDSDDLAGQDRAILLEGICDDLLDAANRVLDGCDLIKQTHWPPVDSDYRPLANMEPDARRRERPGSCHPRAVLPHLRSRRRCAHNRL